MPISRTASVRRFSSAFRSRCALALSATSSLFSPPGFFTACFGAAARAGFAFTVDLLFVTARVATFFFGVAAIFAKRDRDADLARLAVAPPFLLRFVVAIARLLRPGRARARR